MYTCFWQQPRPPTAAHFVVATILGLGGPDYRCTHMQCMYTYIYIRCISRYPAHAGMTDAMEMREVQKFLLEDPDLLHIVFIYIYMYIYLCSICILNII